MAGGTAVLKRQKTKKGTVKVTFALPLEETPEAVSVTGDFNGWDPHANPLIKRNNGTRSAAVEVPQGQVVQFKYLADGGHWFNDAETDISDEGNSVIAA